MISNDRLQKALEYLATTDEPCAKAKALMVGLDESLKSVKAEQFLNAKGTNGERDAAAYASQGYIQHLQKIKDATYDYELMRNKRLTENLVIEVWRSINANRRNGNL